jgi:cysteine desulfurase
MAFRPLIAGGGQERYGRAGTENVAAIAGFGAAAEAALADIGRAAEWTGWREDIAAAVAGTGAAVQFSAGAPRLPQTLCIGVPGVAAETLVIALDLAGVAVSAGAACSSGKVAPSHVLAAMGVAPGLARSAFRISFGWATRPEHLHQFRDAWDRIAARMLAGGARAA